MSSCPYCGGEIENQIEAEWGYVHGSRFTFVCPECGKELEVEVEACPVFTIIAKNKGG